MALFGLFGKKKKKVEIQQESKKVTIKQIPEFLDNKEKELQDQESEALKSINNKIDSYLKNLKEKLDILRQADPKSRKEQDRVKEVVQDSLIKYIEGVSDFIAKFDYLDKENLEKISDQVNNWFLLLDKNTKKHYEKANILVGKEIVNVKKVLKDFSKDMINVFDKNKELIDLFKSISKIKENSEKLNSTNKEIENISQEIDLIETKIGSIQSQEKEIQNKIQETQQTPEYQEILENQKQLESNQKELELIFNSLREKINFKALASFFHKYEKDMEILKVYKESIKLGFEKHGDIGILKLLEESKLNSDEIKEKINAVNEKKQLMKNNQEIIAKDILKEYQEEIDSLNSQIKDFDQQKSKEQKRKEKSEKNVSEILDLIKQDVEKLGGEF